MKNNYANLAKKGSVCPTPFHRLKAFPYFFSIFSVFIHLSVFAQLGPSQTPPATAVFNPTSFEHGDIIALELLYGSSETPATNVSEVSFTVAYEGFDIAPESEMFLDFDYESWLGIGDEMTGSFSVDHDLKLIHVDVERKDKVGQTGWGHVVWLRGLEVVMDDIHKNLEPGIAGIFVKEGKRSGKNTMIQLACDTGKSQFSIVHPEQYNGIVQSRIIDLSGRQVASFGKGVTRWNVGDLSPQIYVITVLTESGIYFQKIRID